MPKSRPGRFAFGFVGGLLVGVVLLALWFLVTGIAVGRDVLALRASASEVQAAAGDGDYAAAVPLLAEARVQAASLEARLSSAPWSWAQSFPVVGTTVQAGATLAGAAHAVLTTSDGLGAELSKADGDLALASAALVQVTPELRATAAAAADAAVQLAAIDTGAVLRPVRGEIVHAQEQLLRIVDPLAQGAVLAQVLPGMLGTQVPVRWLVIIGQPSEARGSGGGFYGAYTSLTVADGRFALEEAAANGPETAVRQDLSSLPDEYERLWGSDATYLWGYNLTRHYPYPASVVHRVLDPSADYVVSLDPRAVAGLMALSGPVTVDGVTLDSSNAELFFARDIYVRYQDPVAKDEVMLAFLQQVFGRLGSSKLEPAALWRALGPAVSGSRIQVWSPDAAVEALLEQSLLGGAVPSLSGPWVTAAFNNTAGNKIDSYVSSELSYTAVGSCASGTISGEVVARLQIAPIPPGLPGYISGRNDEPSAPYGTSSMSVHVYGPSGAVGRSFEVNGVAVPAVQGSERGHPVWGAKVQLAPGAPVEVRATFDQPAFPGVPLAVGAQPMVQDTAVRVVDERSCGVG